MMGIAGGLIPVLDDDEGTRDEEIPFADGNVSAVVRVGETVRRSTGPWTPAVHALLRHLRDAGFTGCPEVLGTDEKGREVLSFVPGETAPASLEGYADDATLEAVARLYQAYHDAVSGFVPPEDAAWRVTVGAPTEGDIVGHNDLGPWNTVFQHGKPVALIDWDFAAPTSRVWDLAYALWRWVPLYPVERFGPPAERARRIARFCAAYGWDDPAALLPVIAERQRVLRNTLVTWGEAGVPGFAEMLRDGHRELVEADIAFFDGIRDEIAGLLGQR
jgi:hypothetical protein